MAVKRGILLITAAEPDVDDEEESGGEDEDADDDASESSSLVGNGRRRSVSLASLPTSQKLSPTPSRVEKQRFGLLSRMADAWNGYFGGRRKRQNVAGEYDSLVGGHEQ